MKSKKTSGFTLIELLLVIIIITTLAVVVFVALDPAKRLRDTRDARRTADLQSILTAIHVAIVDGKGVLPTGLTAGMAEKQLGTAVTGCAIVTGGCSVAATSCLDLSTPLTKYLKTMPIDPTSTFSAAVSGYSVSVDTNGIVTLKACATEGSNNISVSR